MPSDGQELSVTTDYQVTSKSRNNDEFRKTHTLIIAVLTPGFVVMLIVVAITIFLILLKIKKKFCAKQLNSNDINCKCIFYKYNMSEVVLNRIIRVDNSFSLMILATLGLQIIFVEYV